MKKLLKLMAMLLMIVTMSVPMTSCGSDDDDDPKDPASKITGVYTGKLVSDGYVIDDAYAVTVERVSTSVVLVTAPDIFSTTTRNYNVEYNNGIYTLTNSNYMSTLSTPASSPRHIAR